MIYPFRQQAAVSFEGGSRVLAPFIDGIEYEDMVEISLSRAEVRVRHPEPWTT